MEPKTTGIIKILKCHSKETGMKLFATQIQYKPFSNPEYYNMTVEELVNGVDDYDKEL